MGGGTSSYRETEDATVIVLWGSNAREAHPIFFHHVLKAVHRGARLFVVDPRRTSTARCANTWLGIDTGTDIALSNTIAREIIHAWLVHDSFVEHATTGFEEYAASVEDWTLEQGEMETGVPAETIRELAHAYAKAGKAQLCWTLGITEHHNAVDNVLALISLVQLTGHVGRYGSGVNPLRGQNNVQGGGDMGALPDRLPGFQHVENDELRAKFDAGAGVKVTPQRAWTSRSWSCRCGDYPSRQHRAALQASDLGSSGPAVVANLAFLTACPRRLRACGRRCAHREPHPSAAGCLPCCSLP